MKPLRTLVLVSGEETARFFINEGAGKGLTEVAGTSIKQYADAAVDFSDRPGRSGFGAKGTGVQSFEPRISTDEYQRDKFARHVIEALAEEWRAQKPDRLVIAAPPKMLGALRGRLDRDMAAALVADLPKDLVKVTARDLPEHFAKVVVF